MIYASWFSEKHPAKWIPLYSMVTFTHMGYNKAMEQGKIQDKIMKEVMRTNNLRSNFDIRELKEKNIEKEILLKLKNSSF